MKVNIAVIDTGINIEQFERSTDITCIEIPEVVSASNKDLIGHGTAVVYLLDNYSNSNKKYYIINIFNQKSTSNELNLIYSLEYIYKNLDIDIIHISSGVIRPTYLPRLENIVNKLYERGTIIVSAFDNTGSQSYPACLDNVIGVDISRHCPKIYDYIVVKNSTVDILSTFSEFHIPWLNGKFKTVQGTSFSAPIITGMISEIYYKGISYEKIFEILRRDALRVKNWPHDTLDIKSMFEIKDAVIFPVNKETHSLIGNIDKISFNIVDIYDYPFSKHIGQKPCSFIFGSKHNDIVIKSINKLSTNLQFDTFILGHTNFMNNVYERDFIKAILEFCIQNKKNIFSFDDLSNYKEYLNKIRSNGNKYYYYQNIKTSNNNYGKLYRLSSPILAVCGTSPQQGKYNIQLDLRQRFIKDGYSVRQLGTEPSSLLFGMDLAYCNGYGTTIDSSNDEEIYILNRLFKEIDDGDIIIFGTQSQTINYSFGNLGFYTHSQINLLIASEPDAIVLCVNDTDELEYVLNTIIFLEKIIKTHVISIMLFVQKKNQYIQNMLSIDPTTDKEKFGLSRDFVDINERKIPVYRNGVMTDMFNNYKLILEYFKGGYDAES